MSANQPAVEANDVAIAQIYAHLATLKPDTKEFALAVDQLVKLQAFKKEKPSWRPSPDTLITAAAHVGAVLVIVAYEQKHVMASTAKSFAQRMFR